MNETTTTLLTATPSISLLPRIPIIDPSAGVSDWIICLIIFLGAVSAVWVCRRWWRRSEEISRFLQKWRDTPASERFNIDDPITEPIFKALESHCVQIKDGDTIIWNRCVDASDVINEREFGNDLDQYRLLTTMPAVLTGIGIFGTFLGLQFGLQDLRFDPPEMLDQSIRQLVGGVAVAFSTSLWGIGASICLGLIEKFFDQWSKNQLRELQRRIDKDLPKYAPEDALRDVAINTKAAKDTLDGLATQIGDKLQEGIGKAITDSLKGLPDLLAESLSKGMEKEQGRILQNMLTEMSDGIKQQLGTLTAEIASVGGRLSEPLVQATTRLSGTMDQFAETTNRVGQVVEGTATQMDQGLQVIQAQSNIADRLSQTADRFAIASQSLDPFRESLIVAADRNLEAAESQKMASAAQQGFLQSLSGATDKLGDLRVTYENAALALKGIADPIQRLTGLVESLVANSKAGQEANEAAWTKATAALASSGEYIEALSAASKEIHQAAQRFETLKMTLSTAGAQAATATGHIQKATDANERIAASLSAMSSQLPAIAKGLDNTRKETDQAQQDVGGLRDLINGIKAMLAKMGQERDQEEAVRLARLTELINDAADRMQQAAQEFTAVGDLSQALQDAVTGLKGASTNLQAYGTDVKQSAAAHRESAKHSLDAAQEYRELMELLAGLPDSIAEASGTLEKAGMVLREGSTETNATMQSVLKGQNAWLAGTERGLIAMRDQLNSILEKYEEATQGQTRALMEDWKIAVNDAIQSYGQQVEGLREMVDDLKEQLEQQTKE